MPRPRTLRALLLIAVLCMPAAHAAPIHHDLKVTLDPAAQRLIAEDTLSLPAALTAGGATTLEFLLHPDLTPVVRSPGATLRRLNRIAPDDDASPAPVRYALAIPAGVHAVTLAWEGRISHPLREQTGDQARGVGGTPGLISDDGVFLGGASLWYPRFDRHLLSFSLEVNLPAGWDAVSQGSRTLHRRDASATRVRWEEPTPQTEIYLVAGRYHEFSQTFGQVTAYAFLRRADAALAQRYLDATGRYLALFGALLGPYPYDKFALVENFWETGYGMPSFTLLGGSVIRLPFILHSSYPHEILHNWWGNGVYVDYARGNWAEGLTAYLADHLLQEQRGAGAAMRRNHLQRYADYVDSARDFPLIDFRARHSPATEAVGYGKAMMFFHMLRRRLGDDAFIAALRDFYEAHSFGIAGYEDLRRAFSAHADGDLRDEFRQWTIRTGAPRLVAGDANARALGDGRHELTFTIEQTQPGPAYRLQVPLGIALEGRTQALELDIDLRERRQDIRLELPARPLRVDVDPQLDLFRRVDRREIPPALSQLFGARRVMLVVSAAAPAGLRERYRALAAGWRETRDITDFAVVGDDEINTLPADRAVWLLGWDNRFAPALRDALSGLPVTIGDGTIALPDGRLRRDEHSAVLVARHPDDPDLAFGWLAADDPDAVAALARRLPHYGRYGYLGFGGRAHENVLQGQWPVVDPPLSLAVRHADGYAADTPAVDYAPRAPLSAD